MTINPEIDRVVDTAGRPFDRLDGIGHPGFAGSTVVLASLVARRRALGVMPASVVSQPTAPSGARRRQACPGIGAVLIPMRGVHAGAGVPTRIGSPERHHRAVAPSFRAAAGASAAGADPDVRPGPVPVGSATQPARPSRTRRPSLQPGPRPRTDRTGSSAKPIASPTTTDATRATVEAEGHDHE